MSFATPADFLARYDARILGALVTDTGTAESGGPLLTDSVLQTCLDDAAGDIVAACLVGNRYTETDLNGLRGNSLSHLKRINCDIAMRYLADRRLWHKLNETLEEIYKRGMESINELAAGTAIFSLPGTAAASVPNVAGPTTQTLTDLNTISRRTKHYFPTEVLPHNR